MLLKLVCLWILGCVLDVSTVTWKEVQMTAVSSLTPQAPTVIRGVRFMAGDNNIIRLKWTVDPVRDTVRGVSVKLFVQRKSDSDGNTWLHLTSDSNQVAIQPRDSESVTFSRDLEIVPGEFYKAEVALLPESLNSSGIASIKTAPLPPSRVQMISLQTSVLSVSIHFRKSRVDGYRGRLDTPTGSPLSGGVFQTMLPKPLFDSVIMMHSVPITFRLIPGETYRVYIVAQSWNVPAKSETGSKNFLTVAPARPVITIIRRLSETSIHLGWTLPEGKADSFLLYINGAPRTTQFEPVTKTPHSLHVNVTSLDPNGIYEFAVASLAGDVKSDRSEIVTYNVSSGKSITLVDHRTRAQPMDKGTPKVNSTMLPNVTRTDETDTEGFPWPWVISGLCGFILIITLLTVIICIYKHKAILRPKTNVQDFRSSYLRPVYQHSQQVSSVEVEDPYSVVNDQL